MLDNFAEADTERFYRLKLWNTFSNILSVIKDNYEDINDCNTREGKKRYSDN